jgi:hypothetical protein
MSPVSNYFNNYSGTVTNEMRLMEDVVVESIKIMGHDVYYLPREAWSSDDNILGENVASKFTRAYVIEAYLANVDGYEGDGDFFSKFGLEIRDTSNFVVSRRSFERYVPSNITIRPREGDLIFVPVMQKIFEIKFVEEELMFFSIGKRSPYIYELRCELFRYSNENIDTGIEEVDHVEHSLSYTIKLDVNQGNGINFYRNEIVYQGASANLSNSVAVGEVKEWQPLTNSILLMNIKGDFSANTQLIGTSSNARYNISSVDAMGDHVEYDIYDNKQLQDEANTFLDFTEVNIFGNP